MHAHSLTAGRKPAPTPIREVVRLDLAKLDVAALLALPLELERSTSPKLAYRLEARGRRDSGASCFPRSY